MTFALGKPPCVLRVGLKPEAFLGLLRNLEDDDASFVALSIYRFLEELERREEFWICACPAVAGYLLVIRQICRQYEHISPTRATWEEDAVLFQMVQGLHNRIRIRVCFTRPFPAYALEWAGIAQNLLHGLRWLSWVAASLHTWWNSTSTRRIHCMNCAG